MFCIVFICNDQILNFWNDIKFKSCCHWNDSCSLKIKHSDASRPFVCISNQRFKRVATHQKTYSSNAQWPDSSDIGCSSIFLIGCWSLVSFACELNFNCDCSFSVSVPKAWRFSILKTAFLKQNLNLKINYINIDCPLIASKFCFIVGVLLLVF